MNKHLILFLIGTLWAGNVLGQDQNDLRKILASKDFVAFKQYTDTVSNVEQGINAHWESLRDLTADYQEGVFIVERFVPERDNPAIQSVYTYRVNLIATKTTLAFYELSELKNKKVKWKPYYDMLESYKDDTLFQDMKASFSRIFNAELREKGLFVTDFVYGDGCGFVGTDPIGRQIINQWVVENNKANLLTWLSSANTEKQVYAADGLLQLKKTGTSLSVDEMRVINFIINKKGTMFVCSGCSHWHEDITEVTKNLNH